MVQQNLLGVEPSPATDLAPPGEKPWKVPPVHVVGKEIRVRFSQLDPTGNIRQIEPTTEELDELEGSIRAGGMQERLGVYLLPGDADPPRYRVFRGGRRYRVLSERFQYPPDAWIDVIEIPAPASTALDVVEQIKSNGPRLDLAWPDLARAYARATGTIDDEGGIRSRAAIKNGVEAGEWMSHQQLCRALGVKVNEKGQNYMVDQLIRIGVVPYEQLVKLHRAGASKGAAEVFAGYSPSDRPAQLAHYIEKKCFREAPPPEARRGTEWNGGESTGSKSTPPARLAAPAAQPSLFADAGAGPFQEAENIPPSSRPTARPAPAPAPEPRVNRLDEVYPGSARTEREIEGLADHFGLPKEVVMLLDDVSEEWFTAATLATREGPMTDREAEPLEDVIAACGRYRNRCPD